MVVRCRLKDHEDGLVMLNSYYEDGIFQFAPNNYDGFFFLHTFPSTIAFEFKYALFYKFNIKLSIFVARKCSVQLLSTTLTLKRLAENDVKTNVKHKKKCPDVMHESCVTPLLHAVMKQFPSQLRQSASFSHLVYHLCLWRSAVLSQLNTFLL